MKKRVWKRILVVLLVLVVIVGAAGLVLVKSAADMVPRMQKRLEQATSIHYMYYMDIDASSLATTSSARISGDISMVMSNPVAMEMDLTMSGSGRRKRTCITSMRSPRAIRKRCMWAWRIKRT